MPLHPVMDRIISHAYAKGHSNLHLKSVEDLRKHYRQYFLSPKGEPGYDLQVNHCTLRFHRPKDLPGKLPVIIYLRASGYVLGKLGDADYICQELASYTQCVVVAMEPRLSPECKFPTPIRDCYDGLCYLHENHHTLKIDPEKIAIWGESSGGNYAAALSQWGKHDKLLAMQVLVYPLLDYVNPYPSKVDYAKGYLMDNTLTDWFLRHYTQTSKDFSHPQLSPVLAEDFTGLPATLIIAAECDPMRDETMHYYEKLLAAKVPVNAVYFLGVTHGFIGYSQLLDSAQFALQYAADQIIRQFQLR